MRSLLAIIISTLLIINDLKVDAQQKYSSEQLREDVDFLKTELEKLHPNLYKYISKEQFNEVADSLKSNLKPTYTLREAYFQLLPLVQAIECGHTNLMPDKRLLSDNTAYAALPKYFPFGVKLVENKLLISRNYSDNSKLERGTEIVELDGIPSEQILKTLQQNTFFNGDGNNPTARLYYTIREFRKLYFLWHGEQDFFNISYKKQGQEKVKTAKVKAQNVDFIYDMLNKRYPNADEDSTSVVSYRLVDSTQKVAMVDVRSFMRDNDSKSFEGETKKIFRRLSSNNIENLILDLRGNSGGVIDYSIYLLRYLVNQPFETCHIGFRPAAIERMKKDLKNSNFQINDDLAERITAEYTVKTQGGFVESKYEDQRKFKPQEDFHFNKNVYVLMNGGTFSAAALLVSKMHNMGIGTYVGSACGGAYDGCSAARFSKIILPNTEFEISLPLGKIIYNIDEKKYNKEYLLPDFEVKTTTADFLNNEDTVLNYTLNLIKTKVRAR